MRLARNLPWKRGVHVLKRRGTVNAKRELPVKLPFPLYSGERGVRGEKFSHGKVTLTPNLLLSVQGRGAFRMATPPSLAEV